MCSMCMHVLNLSHGLSELVGLTKQSLEKTSAKPERTESWTRTNPGILIIAACWKYSTLLYKENVVKMNIFTFNSQ